MTAFDIITEGLRFPEGPVSMPDGSVLVVEIAGKALTRVSPDGDKHVIAALEGGPNGAAMGPDGWCYLCNSGGWIHEQRGGVTITVGQAVRPGWIERVHLKTGAIETLYETFGGEPLRAPNDLVMDEHGGFWFTDHGKRLGRTRDVGAVYYAACDGSRLARVIDHLLTPNGIGLSHDGRTLFVAETVTRRILAYDVTAPGVVRLDPWPAPAGGRLVAGLRDSTMLDSMAVDARGMVCVATLIDGGIAILSPDGTYRTHYPLPDPFTTNIAFDVRDPSMAYATLSGTGRLVRFAWPPPEESLYVDV